MGFFDRFRRKGGGKGSGKLTVGSFQVEPGKSFRIEYLDFKIRGRKARRTWRKLYEFPVDEENMALAKPEGYAEIASEDWKELVEKVKDKYLDHGIDPDMLDYFVFRLRYIYEKPNVGAIAWTVGVTENDDGTFDFEPDPELPDPNDFIEPEPMPVQQVVLPQNLGQPADRLAEAISQLRETMSTLQQFTEMQNQLRNTILQSLGINAGPTSEEEALERLLEKMRKYDELKKRLGMTPDKDVYLKMMEKMPWWAGMLSMFMNNIGPLMSMLPMFSGIGRMGFPGAGAGGYQYGNMRPAPRPPAPRPPGQYAGAQQQYGGAQPQQQYGGAQQQYGGAPGGGYGYQNPNQYRGGQVQRPPGPPRGGSYTGSPQGRPPQERPPQGQEEPPYLQPADEHPVEVQAPRIAREPVTERAPVRPSSKPPTPPKQKKPKYTPEEYIVDEDILKEFEEELNRLDEQQEEIKKVEDEKRMAEKGEVAGENGTEKVKAGTGTANNEVEVEE